MGRGNVQAMEKQTVPQGGHWKAVEDVPCFSGTEQNVSLIKEALIKLVERTGIPQNIVIDKH